jgi:hypothetical protein
MLVFGIVDCGGPSLMVSTEGGAMGDSIEAVVAKSGETRIQTSLSRSSDGLKVTIWAQPQVEDFLRSLGTGSVIDVQTLGRYWAPAGRELFVYSLSKELGGLDVNGKFSYYLDHPGTAISSIPEEGYSLTRGGGGALNLSFLRLVGISESGGVSFTVKGVYTRSMITQLGSQIEQATQKFYREFLKPYKLVISVSTMPIEGF